MPLTDIAGWIGMILALLAYCLLSFRENITSDSSIFHYLTLIGVTGIGINAFAQMAWPIVALEFIWAILTIIALYRIWRKK